jgi:type IX secretion system PorP/SprF family membrane protein
LKKKLIIIFISLLLLSLRIVAQNTLDFRQFSFNPYLYNPAYAGLKNQTEFDLAYRIQWVGFEGAPTTSAFTIQHPISKAAIGLNLSTEKAGAMQRSYLLGSYAYGVKINSAHALRFGLSGGMQAYNLDLDGEDYSNDPTIMKEQNSVYASGSFGMVYSYHCIKMGFVLPTLFNDQAQGQGILHTHRFNQLLNQFYSLEGTFKFNKHTFEISPFFLYRVNRDLQNYWEAGAMLHLKQGVHTGLSFHQSRGVALFLGFDIRKKLSINYSFESPIAIKNTFRGTSHELQLRFSFTRNSKADKVGL